MGVQGTGSFAPTVAESLGDRGVSFVRRRVVFPLWLLKMRMCDSVGVTRASQCETPRTHGQTNEMMRMTTVAVSANSAL